jgi:hypothetical protein
MHPAGAAFQPAVIAGEPAARVAAPGAARRGTSVAPQHAVAWTSREAAIALATEMTPHEPKPRRPRGRPPIHLSASLNLVMPSQYYPEFAGEGCLPGEKRLMLAVLTDAIDIFLKNRDRRDVRSHRLYVETADWIRATDDDGTFSFVNVCETLGLNPSCLRRGLLRAGAASHARLVRR